MKIVAVMSMRNEVDIVESWIRYYTRMVDHVIITDNLSIDGSGDLVKKLIAEGLPVSLEVDNRLGHLQSERMQKMVSRAIIEFEADWVLLLDADEFLIPPTGKTLYDVFDKLKDDRPLNVAWKTYVPSDSDPDEPNVLKRVSHRLESEVRQFYKMMIPAKIGKNTNVVIRMGNHDILIGSKKIKAQDAPPGMFLAHFPVRSKGQISTKIMVGWLSTLVRPEYTEGENYHWKLLFDDFIENGGAASVDLQNMAINYLGAIDAGQEVPEVIDRPIDKGLSDFNIRYSSEATCRPLKMFAKTAEDIALNHGRLVGHTSNEQSNSPATRKNFLTSLRELLRSLKP